MQLRVRAQLSNKKELHSFQQILILVYQGAVARYISRLE